MKIDMGIVSFLYILLGFIWFLVWPLLLLGKLNPKSKRLIYLLVLPCFVFVSIVATAFSASTKNEYCALCHTMEPYISTWKTSTHAEVDCYRCHSDRGSIQWGRTRIREIVVTLTGKHKGSSNKSIAASTKMSPETCRQCHIIPKKLVHADGIVVSHGKHDEKGISCTSCHNRIVHLKTTDFETERTKEENELGMFLGALEASKDVDPDRTRMQFCMRCHNGGIGKLEAPKDCRTCHTSDYNFKPMNHLIAGFLPRPLAGGMSNSKHGKGAKLDREYCRSCHAEKKCDSCHAYVPMPHPTKNWINGKNLHTISSKAKPKSCMVCHDQPGCTTCHHRDWKIAARQWWNKDNPAISKHVSVARAEGPAACIRCHAPMFCWNCHITKK